MKQPCVYCDKCLKAHPHSETNRPKVCSKCGERLSYRKTMSPVFKRALTRRFNRRARPVIVDAVFDIHKLFEKHGYKTKDNPSYLLKLVFVNDGLDGMIKLLKQIQKHYSKKAIKEAL